MPVIKLQSDDGKIFEVDDEILKQSLMISNILKDRGNDEIVPLEDVEAAILEKVIQWCTHHKDDDPNIPDDENKEKTLSTWDKEFLNVDQSTLCDFMLAANYLKIEGLLNACCQTTALMLKGKTTKEIKEILNINNDFTPPEEKRIGKETS